MDTAHQSNPIMGGVISRRLMGARGAVRGRAMAARQAG